MMRRFTTLLLVLAMLFATFGLAKAPKIQDSIIPLYSNNGKDIICTAFVIDTKRRYLMTADHCLVADSQPMVKGKLAWEVFHLPEFDISIIQADAVWEIPALVPGVTAPVVDQKLRGYGYAEGKNKIAEVDAEVIFPAIGLPGAESTFILYTPGVIPGMSGGPLMTSGKVVGVMQMVHKRFPLGLSRSIDVIYERTKDYWEVTPIPGGK